MTDDLKKLHEAAVKASGKYQKALRATQQSCHHKNLGECDYLPLYDGSLPPIRVCLDCGMSETGWGCGYLVLGGKATPMERDDLYRRRGGFTVTEDHKCRLLRGETTVHQLLATSIRR